MILSSTPPNTEALQRAAQPPESAVDPLGGAQRDGRDLLPAGSPVGSFALRRVLSRDDFSVLYLATSSASSVEVTIEEYLPTSVAQRDEDGTLRPRGEAQKHTYDAGLRAFVEEAEQLSRLSHPALLRVGPVWQTRGTAYRLRLLPPWRALTEIRAEMGAPPDEAWMRRLLDPLLEALRRVHDAGLAHGNVRPGNIVITESGAPILLDFGAPRVALAADIAWLSARAEPEYQAPELVDPRRGWPVSAATDLYSLAAVARWCLNGEAPLGARSRLDGQRDRSLAELLQESGRPRAGPWSEGLVETLERAFALEPTQRPQSTVEMRREFDRPPRRPVVAPLRPQAAPPVPREPAVGTHPAFAAPGEPAPPAGVFMAPQAASPQAFAGVRYQADGPDLGPLTARVAPPVDDREPPWLSPEWFASSRAPAAEPVARREPELASARAPSNWTPPRNASAARRWPWALGGVLVGAALALAFALGTQRLANDARLAWAAISLPSVPRSILGASPNATPAPTDPSGTGIQLPASPNPTPAASPAAAPPGDTAPPAAAGGPAATAVAPAQPPTAGNATASPTAQTPATAPAGVLPATPLSAATTSPGAAAATVAPAPAASASSAAPPSTVAAPAVAQSQRRPAAPPPREAAAPRSAPRQTARAGSDDSGASGALLPRGTQSIPMAPAGNRAPSDGSGASGALLPRGGTPAPAAAGTSGAAPTSPMAACGPRSNQSLYQCMRNQCAQDRFYAHPQCVRLRRDGVS